MALLPAHCVGRGESESVEGEANHQIRRHGDGAEAMERRETRQPKDTTDEPNFTGMAKIKRRKITILKKTATLKKTENHDFYMES